MLQISQNSKKKNIYKYLNEQGYPKAQLDAKAYVDIDEYKVDIVYKVEKNNLQYFGKSRYWKQCKCRYKIFTKRDRI